MATNFQSRSDVQVILGTAASSAKAVGTAHAAGDTWHKLQVIDYNIEHASAPIDVAPSRSGIYGQIESQGHHRPDNQMYEVTLTMRGTTTAVLQSCLSLFGASSSAAILDPSDNTGDMTHGIANASQFTIVFANAGSDKSTNNDVVMKGCFATSMVLRQDVGTNGGEMVVETTFVTAYQPSEEDLNPTSPTIDVGSPRNIFDLGTSTIDSVALTLNNFEISITRPLARVHFQPGSASFDPNGYVQTGPYEVTGSITAKRDDSINDIADHIKGDSAGIALSLVDSTLANLNISCPDIMIDNSKPEVSDFLLQTIPFRAFAAKGADQETNTIISITIAN
jgi:hypothetical protein